MGLTLGFGFNGPVATLSKRSGPPNCSLQADRWKAFKVLRARVDFDAHRFQSGNSQDWFGIVGTEDDCRADPIAHKFDLGDADFKSDLAAVG